MLMRYYLNYEAELGQATLPYMMCHKTLTVCIMHSVKEAY